ncbi:MAG: patatin-like phospholipase family protein [Candidatus Cloacimonetes bacterium]|nr:patatin-like phospholipase family protein [Candidatus Cloacimonadota bacterium]MBS3767642.1 patatin-like phospholipase family protein [Candidatus Cloacimonadota bacterium]
MKFWKKHKNIGLALGGGAVLGAVHIGVLKALEEHDIKIDYIAGTSIGSIIAALFAFAKDWQEIKEITDDLNWWDVSAISLSNSGLLSNKKIQKVLAKHIGDVNLEDAEIPVAMVAADITTGEKVVLKEGRVDKAAMASTCIPGVFVPVEINDRLLVDGGIVESVPISAVKEMGADYIIAVDLTDIHAQKKPQNILEVLLRSFDFTIKNATQLQTEEADLHIRPDLADYNRVEVDQRDDLFEMGYEEAKKVLANF